MPAMSSELIKKQQEDVTGILESQATSQKKMLDNQYDAQKRMVEAEAKRMIEVTTEQYGQQKKQALAALDMSYNQQINSLNMARQQREMAITPQAAQMSAQAKQHELQVEMQKSLMQAYSGTDPKKPEKPLKK